MDNRIELAKHFATLGFTKGAEIGVCWGRYSEILCRHNPKLHLLAVDNWHKKLTWESYESAKVRLANLNVTIDRRSSMEAAVDVADESLDFVFIDANHEYTAVRDDIREWSKKVRIGGIVAGHDYYKTKSGNMGVINAVNEYVTEHDYTLLLTDKVHISSGTAGMPPGGSWNQLTVDDRFPCWYFTKK